MEKYKKIVKFSPYISSENIGDQIIRDYCNLQLEEIFGDYFAIDIPTREKLGVFCKKYIATSDYRFICGTNLLTSHMKKSGQWNVTLRDAFDIRFYGISRRRLLDIEYIKEYLKRNKMLLMGVGWAGYQSEPDFYTKTILRTLLDSRGLHSVRDNYTEKKLKECGIENVVNTACPTMWKLTKDFCKKIPTLKADSVVTTLTSYDRDQTRDSLLLDILLHHYNKVYIWLQGPDDYDALRASTYFDQIEIIPPTLNAYDLFLKNKNIDYIGTRLHGGIKALNDGHRTIIIAIDNRALEISKDTGLMVIKREEIGEYLERQIEDEFETVINLPEENISRWKEQFKQG